MKKYKLFGFLNMFDVIPDFVYPVFQNESILYFQEGKEDKIYDFVPVKESTYKMIISIENFKEPVKNRNMTLTKESQPVYIFQLTEDKIVCGHSDYMLNFFSNYKTNNIILREEIDNFITEIKSAHAKKTARQENSNKYYGTGRLNASIARVYLKRGTGKITINRIAIDDYSGLESLKSKINEPFIITNSVGKYDVFANVRGGSFLSQAGAIRQGIARALLEVNKNYMLPLKRAGYLMRNPRMAERKKYGLRAARQAPQVSKR